MGNDVKVGLNNNQGERKKLQRKILLDKNYLRYYCWKKNTSTCTYLHALCTDSKNFILG